MDTKQNDELVNYGNELLPPKEVNRRARMFMAMDRDYDYRYDPSYWWHKKYRNRKDAPTNT